MNRPTEVILFNIDSRADTEDKEDAIQSATSVVFNERLGYCADHPHIAHLWSGELMPAINITRLKSKFSELKRSFGKKNVMPAVASAGMKWRKAQVHATGQSEALGAEHGNLERYVSRSILTTLQVGTGVFRDRSAQESGGKADGQTHRLLADEAGQFYRQQYQYDALLQTITENRGTACGGQPDVTPQEDI